MLCISGEVEVTADQCQDLLAGADMLGLSDVVEACCTFMKIQLSPDNCCGMYYYDKNNTVFLLTSANNRLSLLKKKYRGRRL